MTFQRRGVCFFAVLALAFFFACLLIDFSSNASAAKKKKKAFAPLPGLAIGIDDSALRDAQTAPLALDRSREIGASFVRVTANWSNIAPTGSTKPAGFDPRSPADPRYRWSGVDGQIKRAVAAGFTPYVTILHAPTWAQVGTAPASANAGGGAWKPSAVEFGNFAHAAAARYSGAYADATSGGILPNVAVWQAWNEPNLPLFLAPSSPELYRGLLNSMHDEIKAVQPNATIVTAGLAPVKSSPAAAFPKDFAQKLLCVTPSNGWFDKDPSCSSPAKFDVLGLHPYSLRAKPTQRAAVIGNMFVSDTEDFSQMLKAASANDAVSPGAKRLWITEFAWFTNPPNKTVGDPPDVAGRRTSIALYLLWHAGATQITWSALSDDSGAIVKGGGLFDAGGRAKPTYRALRFPFFARQDGRRLLIWGRSPAGSSRNVSIKSLRDGNSNRIATIKPLKGGIFQKRLTLGSNKSVTVLAQQGSERSPSIGSRDFFEN